MHEFGHLLNVGKIPTDDVGDIVGKFEDYLSKNTHAITVAIGEPSIRLAQEDEILQIERVVWLALVYKKSIDVAKTYSATAEDSFRS